MSEFLSRRSAMALLAVVAAMSSGTAHAQAPDAAAWTPRQPIRLLIGFAAGGGNDIFGRMVAQRLSERLHQPVVVENKPGAGSIIAFEATAHAAADGYTLVVAPFGASIITPAVYAKLPYDPATAFQPISIVASFPFVMAVASTLPAKSVEEVVAYAKAHPDQANYGTPSVTFQLLVEQFKAQTGAPFEHIPFKSTAEVVTGLLNGQLMMSFVDPGPLLGHLKSGRIRALALSSPARFPELPDVPTMVELGYPDVMMDSFMGIMGPRGLPEPVLRRLETELVTMAGEPEFKEHLRLDGLVPVGGTAQQFADRIAREIPQWKAVAQKANVKLE